MPQASSEHSNADSAAGEVAGNVEIIKEQTRETMALLRQLVEMLLPKSDPDRPKLEDLIAALVAQQARILAIVGQHRLDMAAVLELLRPTAGGLPERRQPTNGGLQS